jgi:flagellar motility protein MotE (MotC chaperone)
MPKEKTMHELAKEFPDKTYRELEIYRDADRNEEAAKIPLTESQKSQEDLEPITKGVCVTGALRRDREPRSNLDRLEKENNDLYNRVAELIEINESHQKLNGKLQERLTELEEENKKIHDHLNKRIESVRKSGM